MSRAGAPRLVFFRDVGTTITSTMGFRRFLLQPRILRFSLRQDGDVGIGIFP